MAIVITVANINAIPSNYEFLTRTKDGKVVAIHSTMKKEVA